MLRVLLSLNEVIDMGGSSIGREQGLFIVFEGIDGAGTSTQACRMQERMCSANLYSLLTFEPTNFHTGDFLIRGYIKGDRPLLDWRSMSLLFSADRYYHCTREINPYLAEGNDVICDRYVWSTLAYQGATATLGCSSKEWRSNLIEVLDWIQIVNKFVTTPDLIIYLDVPVKVAQDRIAERGLSKEVYEHGNFQEKVRDVYNILCEGVVSKERLLVIDGTKSEDEISDICFKRVFEMINSNRKR